MHPDPYIPARRSSGAPDYQDQQAWALEQSQPRPADPARISPFGVLAVILCTLITLYFLGAAAVVGWDRAEARVTGCDSFRGAEMTACVQARAR